MLILMVVLKFCVCVNKGVRRIVVRIDFMFFFVIFSIDVVSVGFGLFC